METRRRMRYLAEDIWAMPEDGKIYEVIDGELYMTPPPSFWHQLAVRTLVAFIDAYIRPRKLGVVLPAPTGVVLDADNGVEPDVVYLSADRMHLISDRGIEGAPDMVTEVLSPSTQARDRTIKMRRYAAAGVPHFWIANPVLRTLEAYRLGAEGYELTGTYGPASTFRPELFPGLEIPIDELWS